MKKIITLILILCLAVTAFAGCGAKEATGEAYATVHGAGYVGKATVTVTVISHGAEKQATYYKTVKFDGVTATFNADKKTYEVNGTAWLAWLQTEANAKKYFDAVAANNVAVTVNGADDKSVMTAKVLLKSQNGYGGSNFDWAGNKNATIDYVVANGFKVASSLTKNDEGKWADSNGVVTGATWTDMNTQKENSLSYIAILQKAYDKVASK